MHPGPMLLTTSRSKQDIQLSHILLFLKWEILRMKKMIFHSFQKFATSSSFRKSIEKFIYKNDMLSRVCTMMRVVEFMYPLEGEDQSHHPKAH